MQKLFVAVACAALFLVGGCTESKEKAMDKAGEAGAAVVDGAKDMGEKAMDGAKDMADKAMDGAKEAATSDKK